MVLITALIRALNARFGEPVDVLTSGSWSAPLLEGQPGVGEILCVRSRKTPYWLAPNQHRVVRKLRSRGAGPTWFCDANEAARPMLERAGIPDDYIVDVKDHPLKAAEHATEQWRRLADLSPKAPPVPAPLPAGTVAPGAYLSVSPSQEADLDAWLEARGLAGSPLVLVQAGNKRTMRRGLRRLAVNHKYWPNERWGAVLLYLRARCPGHRIVLLGTGPEYRLNEELMAAARIPDVCNAADDLPIPRLVALLVARRRPRHRRLGAGARGRCGGVSAGGAVRARLALALPAVGNGRRRREGAHREHRRRAEHARHRRHPGDRGLVGASPQGRICSMSGVTSTTPRLVT